MQAAEPQEKCEEEEEDDDHAGGDGLVFGIHLLFLLCQKKIWRKDFAEMIHL